MSDFNIFITDSAVKKISELQKQEESNKYLRISVEGGGCGGFQYNYYFVKTQNTDDIVVTINNVSVVIDETSQDFLNKCELDYVRELGNEYFNITNPNASSNCGCGNSFSV